MPRKSSSSSTVPGLFNEEQPDLLDKSYQEAQEARAKQPVECLGIIFPNDAARREHFTKLLAEKLKDTEFRSAKGFPTGTDADILAVSNPPYYTVCPNPWLSDFHMHYGKSYDSSQPYHREPFTADVRQGKNHPIYDAHSYHTKVPHRAIMRFILHYTEPGDIVFDGFCGTGMTGVAARLCGDKSEIEALGYRVAPDGKVFDENGRQISKIGTRNAILNDLSPAATFIASNYNSCVDMNTFEREGRKILEELESELGWMYETIDAQGRVGRINFTVWSDVFICGNCQEDVVFLDVGVDDDGGVTAGAFGCPHCTAILQKSTATKRMESVIGHHGNVATRIKKVPVTIDFTTSVKRTQKPIGNRDKETLAKIETIPLPDNCPFDPLNKEGEQYKRDALHLRGMDTVADFYTRRNLIALTALWQRANNSTANPHFSKFWVTSIQWLASNMYRFRGRRIFFR